MVRRSYGRRVFDKGRETHGPSAAKMGGRMPAMQNLPRSARSSLLLPLLAAASLLFPLPVASAAPQAAPAAPAKAALEQPGWKLAPPTELHEVEKVVDGDTVHILRGGKLEKLRLNCVDTEEKMATNSNDPTKPSTTFGEDCAQWAAKFFADLAEPGQKPRSACCSRTAWRSATSTDGSCAT
jgi:hypothetical protein